MNIINLLREMTQISAPSGSEMKITAYIQDFAEQYCDEVYTDAMGNLIARKKGTGKRVMFAAHCDEIGIIVTDIDKNGFIYFSKLGGLNIRNLVNLRVVFQNGTEGVIVLKNETFKDEPSYEKLYIDIGAKNGEDAKKSVNIGDCAVFAGNFYQNGDTVISKAIDNRAGCALLLYAMADRIKSGNDLYFVFTVQEEVGLRGAKAAAFAIEPDIAIAVDVTDTGDEPCNPRMAVKMGGGAAVKIMDRSVICDAYVRSNLVELAKNNKIPYQLEIMTDGSTDAGAIHLTRSGVKSGGISVPTRYIHSISEMADAEDIKHCGTLLRKAAQFNW